MTEVGELAVQLTDDAQSELVQLLGAERRGRRVLHRRAVHRIAVRQPRQSGMVVVATPGEHLVGQDGPVGPQCRNDLVLEQAILLGGGRIVRFVESSKAGQARVTHHDVDLAERGLDVARHRRQAEAQPVTMLLAQLSQELGQRAQACEVLAPSVIGVERQLRDGRQHAREGCARQARDAESE